MSDSDSSPVSTSSTTGSAHLPALRRRDFAGIAAAVAAAPVIGLVPDIAHARPPARAGAGAGAGRLRLQRDPGSVVSALDLPLTGASDRGRVAPKSRVRTAILRTTEFSMLGVTWHAGAGRIRARTRRVDGEWSEWRVLPALRDLPDPDRQEGRGMPHATEPLWVGPCDAVQLEVGAGLVRPTLRLIDPGERDEDNPRWHLLARKDDGSSDPTQGEHDGAGEPDATGDGADAAREEKNKKPKKPPRPKVHYRRDWGPNRKFLNGDPGTIKTVKQVHVHHTVNSNEYKKSDVPKLIRAMYRYHTNTLGWSDIGYNFLVDRFGRIWVGRRHSCRMTRGAHTLGFNHSSVGVSVIGNFEAGKPNKKVIRAIARIAAWKLAKFDRDPMGKIKVTSHGSDRFAYGRRVKLPVIDGHRDTNETACPGRHLYRELPRIRKRTAKRIGSYVG